MKKLKIILSALIISIAACSAASAETVVRLLVNRNGIKNSVRIDRFVEMKKGYTVSLKDKNLGKLSADGMKYTTTDHGVNQIFIYDENNRKKETITVVSYKWIAHRGYSGQYVENTVKTGLFAYCVGGRYGLMDANCHRLTEPLYKSISAVNKNMFRATLLDHYSEVILNAKGEVMK